MNLIIPYLVSFFAIFIRLLYWAIFLRVIMSWFARGRTTFGEFVYQITEPILWPFRWARIAMFDFSPILALIALDLVGTWIRQLLYHFL